MFISTCRPGRKKYPTVFATGIHVVDQLMKQLRKCFVDNTKTETDKRDRKLRYRKAHV
jgi:hypothetical protein